MKKVLKIAIVVVVALIAGYNVYAFRQSAELSDLALANIEALSNDEIVDKCKGCATYYLGKKCCTLIWSGQLETVTLYYDYK